MDQKKKSNEGGIGLTNSLKGNKRSCFSPFFFLKGVFLPTNTKRFPRSTNGYALLSQSLNRQNKLTKEMIKDLVSQFLGCPVPEPQPNDLFEIFKLLRIHTLNKNQDLDEFQTLLNKAITKYPQMKEKLMSLTDPAEVERCQLWER